jgi:hypothetical protein
MITQYSLTSRALFSGAIKILSTIFLITVLVNHADAGTHLKNLPPELKKHKLLFTQWSAQDMLLYALAEKQRSDNPLDWEGLAEMYGNLVDGPKVYSEIRNVFEKKRYFKNTVLPGIQKLIQRQPKGRQFFITDFGSPAGLQAFNFESESFYVVLKQPLHGMQYFPKIVPNYANGNYNEGRFGESFTQTIDEKQLGNSSLFLQMGITDSLRKKRYAQNQPPAYFIYRPKNTKEAEHIENLRISGKLMILGAYSIDGIKDLDYHRRGKYLSIKGNLHGTFSHLLVGEVLDDKSINIHFTIGK